MIMSATNFKTVNQTYRQLISNGIVSLDSNVTIAGLMKSGMIFGKIYSMLLEMMKTK